MKYDFDQVISRQDTDCAKYGRICPGDDPLVWVTTDECFSDDPLLPMWVADMDFAAPQPVIDALVGRARHGLFGYTMVSDDFHQAVVGWMQRRHGWAVDPDWICTAPGVVPALFMIVRAFTAPGEGVLIQPPVYYPFYNAIERTGRRIVRNPLIFENGRYTMDFADLEQKVSAADVKLAILCSPHNPVGRVWDRDELARFGDICLEHDVLVASDEIHSDLMLNQTVFTPYGMLSPDLVENVIICHAPSKTFNLAGLKTSNLIIPNQQIRQRYQDALQDNAMLGVNAFGIVALKAAYNHGEEWLEQCLDYLNGNLAFLEAYVAEHIPQLSVIRPQGTYLVWLDCRSLGLDKHALKRLFLEQARVYLDDGYLFGDEGDGFQRMNIACPRSILATALDRIREAIAGLEPASQRAWPVASRPVDSS
jgi:cystathionine beta-lyase